MFRPYTRAVSVGNFKRPVAAAADVTPNTIGWSDVYRGSVFAACADPTYDTYDMPAQQITGITTPITLNIDYEIYNDFSSFYVSVSNTSSYGTTTADLDSGTDLGIPYPYTKRTSISVNNNQYLIFRIGPICVFCQGYVTHTITIRNASDGNALLASFTYDAQYSGYC